MIFYLMMDLLYSYTNRLNKLPTSLFFLCYIVIDNKETIAFQVIYHPTITNVEFRDALMSTIYDIVHLTGHGEQKKGFLIGQDKDNYTFEL